jgi:hypothetical protein
MRETQSDPVIDEIREIRHRISARFDHDPAKLVAHYMEFQKQYEDRLLKNDKGTEQSVTNTAQEDRE